jgi:hypothetical protein
VIAGCTTSPAPATSHGVAEVHVNAAPAILADLTRFTVEAAGQIQDLVLDPASGTLDASLFLPAGMTTVVARAFVGDTLAGASAETAVDIEAGAVTRVTLRIIDQRVDEPLFGPILDSLVVPTTTTVGAQAAFAISAVAPAGDPITYAWSSDCADSTFSAPDAASTRWSSSSAESCRVTVVATSNEIALTESFLIVVFAAGTQSGALDADGEFIAQPQIGLELFGSVSCANENGFRINASCPDSLTSPTTTNYMINVFNWGLSAPGTLELTDDCGGGISALSGEPGFTVQGEWLPPAAGGICQVTARAVNADGGVATATVAVLTHPGEVVTSMPPQISGQVGNECFFSSTSPTPTRCPAQRVGTDTFFFLGGLNWVDGTPGTVVVTDTCGRGRTVVLVDESFARSWTLSGTPGATCTVTVEATSLEGATTQTSVQFLLQ